MTKPKTYDQCEDQCTAAYPGDTDDEWAEWVWCMDDCDEQFAAGVEPPAPPKPETVE